MKVSKAIEILEDILRHVEPGDPPDEHDAVKLGIEALKRAKEMRSWPNHIAKEPLPGETPAEEAKRSHNVTNSRKD